MIRTIIYPEYKRPTKGLSGYDFDPNDLFDSNGIYLKETNKKEKEDRLNGRISNKKTYRKRR